MADVDDLLARLARVLAEEHARGRPLPDRLCRSAARILGCDGGAITLAYTRAERVSLCVTDETAQILEEVQDVVGQGPGPEAFSSASYVRFDLVETAASDSRWPLLDTESLMALAPLVVHALPMAGGSEQVVGVLTLYQRGTGRDIDPDAAMMLTRVTAAILLADDSSTHDSGLGHWSERAEVHQATGMVVAQLGVSEDDALALLRAHAYSHDQSMGHIAHDVVTRQIIFSADPDQEIDST